MVSVESQVREEGQTAQKGGQFSGEAVVGRRQRPEEAERLQGRGKAAVETVVAEVEVLQLRKYPYAVRDLWGGETRRIASRRRVCVWGYRVWQEGNINGSGRVGSGPVWSDQDVFGMSRVGSDRAGSGGNPNITGRVESGRIRSRPDPTRGLPRPVNRSGKLNLQYFE